MSMNKFKFMCFLVLMTSIMGGLSSMSFMSMWIFMELNMMSFIVLTSLSKDKFSFSNIIIYFIPQATASSMFLISNIYFLLHPHSFGSIIMMTAMMIKMGVAPFHTWFICFVARSEFSILLLVMTLQKLLPLMIVFLMKDNIVKMFMILNAMIGALGMIKQSSMKYFIAYYSLFSSSWIIASLLYSTSVLYMSVFFVTLLMGYSYMTMKKDMKINMNSNSANNLIILSLFMLFLAGLPPFVPFFPKVFILKELLLMKDIISFFLLTLLSIMIFWAVVELLMFNISKTTFKKVVLEWTPNSSIVSIFFFLPSLFIMMI